MTNRVYHSTDITLDGTDAESWYVKIGTDIMETIAKAGNYSCTPDTVGSTLYILSSNCQFSINYPSRADAQAALLTIDGFRVIGGGGGGGATLAEQQAQTAILEEIKDLVTLQSPGLTWTKTVASITTASDDIIVANPNRRGLIINNRPGGAIVYCDPSGGTCTTNDLQIASNAYVSFSGDSVPKTNVTGKRASGIGTLTVYEGV